MGQMNITNSMPSREAPPSILLVDDEEDILPEYQDFLELEGFESLTCSDPQRAVDMVLDVLSIRLVITDLRMAKLDGASLIRRLRTLLPMERHVEFIILTGDATSQMSDDLIDVPVFIKPADTEKLVAEIRSALVRSQ